MTTDQRRHPRRPIELAVVVTDAADRVHGQIVFDTQDVSLGGAFVRSDLLFEIGEELALAFELPTGQRIVARGKVVRVARDAPEEGQPAGMGIQFVALSESDRSAILALTNLG